MAIRKRAFYAGANMLRLFDTSTGTENALSGLSLDNGVDGSTDGALQTVESETQGDGASFAPVLFPYEGMTVVAAADFSGATVRFRIGVRFLDADKEEISESFNDFIASGRRSHSAVVPENTVYIQWISTREEASASDDGEWTFTRPSLRTNSSSYSN